MLACGTIAVGVKNSILREGGSKIFSKVLGEVFSG